MKKLFWGLFFIVAGIFVLINQLGYTDIDLFSLLLTIFIIPMFIKSLIKINFFGILFSLAFLAIIYSEPLNLGNITPWPVLITALLGSIGLSIMFGKHKVYSKCCVIKSGSDNHSEVVDDTDGEDVNFSVSFGSSIKYVNSDDFKKADLRCSLGEMKVYFDNAKIKGEKATINIDVSLSGVELYIPKEWKIINKVDSTLGAVDIKNPSHEKAEKTVTITGRVNLGGVQIIYV